MFHSLSDWKILCRIRENGLCIACPPSVLGGKGRGMALTVLWSSRRKVTFATSLGFCKSFEVQEKTANILLETWTRLHVQEFHT